VFHDRDHKYGTAFDEELTRQGVNANRVMYRAPNLQAFVERWIQTIEVECLDHFVVLGETHLNFLVSKFARHYHSERPHQSMGNAPLVELPAPPKSVPRNSEVTCTRSLGGLVKHFSLKAA
jgi:putative transposase